MTYKEDDGYYKKNMIFISNYEYSSDNKLIKEDFYELEDSIQTEETHWGYKTYNYDDGDHLIKTQLYDFENNLFDETIYDYNDKNELVKQTIAYHADLLSYTRWANHFDELDIYSCYGIPKETNYYIKYEYDEKGNLIKESVYKADGSYLGLYTYEYNEDNRIKLWNEYLFNLDGIDGFFTDTVIDGVDFLNQPHEVKYTYY